MDTLAAIWAAYSGHPTKTAKSILFNHSETRNKTLYNKIFITPCKRVHDNMEEAILACRLSQCIHKQASVYHNSSRNGQIIAKLSNIQSKTLQESEADTKQII